MKTTIMTLTLAFTLAGSTAAWADCSSDKPCPASPKSSCADTSSQNSRAALTRINPSCCAPSSCDSQSREAGRSEARKVARDAGQMTVIYSSKGGSSQFGSVQILR